MEGSISLPRGIAESSWGNNPIIFYVFVRLVMKANWKDDVWQGMLVHRGELVTSVHNFAHELRLTDNQVKHALRCLQNDKQISIKSTNRFSNITICNYDSYQHSQKTDSQTNLLATSPTKVNNRINKEINKEEKKDTNVSKEKLIFPFSSDAFMSVWNILASGPKWKKKTIHALQLSLNKLKNYDEEFAIRLIENAIEKNYQGLVYDTTDVEYERWKKTRYSTTAPNQSPPSPKEPAAPSPQKSYDELIREAKNPTEDEIKEHIEQVIKPFNRKRPEQTEEEYEREMRVQYERGKEGWILDRIAAVNRKVYG